MQIVFFKHVRRAGLSLVLAGLVVGHVSACDRTPTAPEMTTTTAPAAANDLTPGIVRHVGFNTDHEIGVISEDKIVSRVAASPVGDTLSFTSDSRFLFAASHTDSSTQIVSVDTTSFASRTVPVSTQEIYPGSGSNVLWWESPNRLMSLDLSIPDAEPTVSKTIDFPAATYRGQPAATPRLIAANGSLALFSRMEDLRGAVQRLYLVDGAGRVSSIDVTQGDMPVGSARFSQDGNTIAFSSNPRYCGHGVVGLIDAHADALKFVELPDKDSTWISTRVARFWWGPGNVLMASISVKDCNHPDQGKDPTVWRLEDNRWVQTADDTAIQKARVSGTQIVALVPNASKGNDLVMLEGGKTNNLVQNVQYMVDEP